MFLDGVYSGKRISVIHMAAQALVRQSYKYTLEILPANVMGTARLLDAVRSI